MQVKSSCSILLEAPNKTPVFEEFDLLGLRHVNKGPPDQAVIEANPNQLFHELALTDTAADSYTPLDLHLH